MADRWMKQVPARRSRFPAQFQPAPVLPGKSGPDLREAESAEGSPPLHLGELVPVIRDRLKIDRTLSDDDIIGSLTLMASRTDMRARWLSAFNSPLGRWLVVRGSDLNTSLNTVLALLPPARM